VKRRVSIPFNLGAMPNFCFNSNFSFELRLGVSLSMEGDLSLISRVRNINGKSFSFAFAYHTYLCSWKVVCFYMPSLLLKTCPCLSVAVCLHLCLKLTITSIILCTSYLWADMAVFSIFIIRQEWYFSLGSIDIMITVLNWELYMLLLCCHPCAFISWNVSSWKLEIYVS
jgi:hypothetical protein